MHGKLQLTHEKNRPLVIIFSQNIVIFEIGAWSLPSDSGSGACFCWCEVSVLSTLGLCRPILVPAPAGSSPGAVKVICSISLCFSISTFSLLSLSGSTSGLRALSFRGRIAAVLPFCLLLLLGTGTGQNRVTLPAATGCCAC